MVMHSPSPPNAPEPPRGSRASARRSWRIAKIALLVILALFLAPILLLTLTLATPPGARTLINLGLSLANPWRRTTLRADEARAGLMGIELHGLRLMGPGGRVQIGIDTLAVRYTLAELSRKPLTVRSIEIAGVTVSAQQMQDGRFDLLAPFGGPPTKPKKEPTEVRVGSIVLRRGAFGARLRADRGVDSLAI